ncbi:hypothetical protein F183_A15340 [Bryobacterales bacterium F-183]|nr:hypothetical protein F183_A15340 [Bryobacterales bacterium F-183]
MNFALPAAAQVFVSAQGGAAAISNGAAVSASPVAAASYDSKPGAAFAASAGYLFNDWIGAESVYSFNRNRILTSEVAGSSLNQREFTAKQHSWTFEAMLYFRPRTSRIRPYLSAGPSLVQARERTLGGLRVAVGTDLMLSNGWGFRYSFSEVMSRNPLATDLRPSIGGKLLNFQNQFGIVKVFR